MNKYRLKVQEAIYEYAYVYRCVREIPIKFIFLLLLCVHFY